MKYAKHLGSEVYQLNLIESDSPYRTTGYLIVSDKTVLIETGSSFSNPILFYAFQEIGIQPEQIDHIIVTHVHLDHAGGAGLLMSQCVNARLIVHEKGKKHLVDPSKLVAGARVVYGDKFDGLFNPVLPIDEDRVDTMHDGEELEIGKSRTLKFLDTPGHAFHHLAVRDSETNGIFTGDCAGIFYKNIFEEYGIRFCIPVTAPTQFSPLQMNQTLDRLINLQPERIYFTHFGMSNSAAELLSQAKELTAFFGMDCAENFRSDRDFKQLITFIEKHLKSRMNQLGIPENFSDANSLHHDVILNAQGVVAYVEHQDKVKEQ